MEPQPAQQVMRLMWLVLLANLLAAALKFALALLTGSVMLRGDAYFTLLDAGVDVLLLAFMRYSAKPADARHPYGHSKFEALAVAAVAVLIFSALQDLALRVWRAWQGGAVPVAEAWHSWLLVVLLLGNLLLAIWQLGQARRWRSSALAADAWYTLSGCVLTILSLVALQGAARGLQWPDALGSSLAFVFTLVAGILVGRGAMAALTDESRLAAQEVEAAVLSIEGVLGVHQVRSRGAENHVHVDLHVEVAPQLTVLQAHVIASLVEGAVQERFPEVVDVTVHIEPRMLH